jgi:hypothetical protein
VFGRESAWRRRRKRRMRIVACPGPLQQYRL